METSSNDLLVDREGAVVWVTFNRPAARNAMTFGMYDGLVKVMGDVEADPSVRVLVLLGAGDKAFVAGTDINQFRAFKTPQDALDYETRIDTVIGRLESLARPTIAMVHGYAVGGGAALALACDLRICTPSARIGVPIARTLGNCLSMNNYARLVDLVGPARAKELLFTAKLIDAREALQMGLANEVVEPEVLRERVRQLAEQIASHAPLTVQVSKEAIRRVLLHRRPEKSDDLILRAYLSDDFREGIDAFLAKRKPVWRGQ